VKITADYTAPAGNVNYEARLIIPTDNPDRRMISLPVKSGPRQYRSRPRERERLASRQPRRLPVAGRLRSGGGQLGGQNAVDRSVRIDLPPDEFLGEPWADSTRRNYCCSASAWIPCRWTCRPSSEQEAGEKLAARRVQRNNRRRNPLPESPPRILVERDLTQEQKKCRSCRRERHRIGEEAS